MATTKKGTAKKNPIDDNQIISMYMDFVLEHNEAPKNIYTFCKENDIEEAHFYSFFGSFEAVKQDIWVKFFDNATATIQKDENYNSYSDKNKLLTLYFTLFEILTLNRSYVLQTLKENNQGLQNLKDLKQFRNHFKDFVISIIDSNENESAINLDKIKKPVFSEGAWIQFLFILKFWLNDTSKSFEKTDIIIEKSVNTVVDLLNTKPLESLLDLGKFLWKERKM
jgi:hypothetical protein